MPKFEVGCSATAEWSITIDAETAEAAEAQVRRMFTDYPDSLPEPVEYGIVRVHAVTPWQEDPT